jgi:putative ABC transport system substrate-binding protein
MILNNLIKGFSKALVLIPAFLFLNSLNAEGSRPTPPKRISILQVAEHSALNATRQGIIDELTKANIETNYDTAQNNPILAAQIAQKLVGTRPNVLVGIGTTSTQALVSENREPIIPIIFSSVTDPVSARLLNNLNKPNGSTSGVSNFIEVSKQFELFKTIVPQLKKLGVIYNPGEPNSVTLLKDMQKQSSIFHFEIIEAPANSSTEVPQATQRLMTNVDAIFINNDNTALSAFDAIIKITNEYKIPVFVSDTDMTSRGALAALGPNQYEIGRQTAKMVIQVLNGRLLEDIPVAFPDKTELHINLITASKLGIKIPDSLLRDAISQVKKP